MRHWRPYGILSVMLAGEPSASDPRMPRCGRRGPVAVAPPPGASPRSRQLPPFERVSSPYLHTTSATYAVQRAPQAVYAYYLPKLERLGYRASGKGSISAAAGITGWDWSFSRGTGMSDTVLLTVQPAGPGSLHSLACELIVAPARPAP